jgi:hypothetical protein
VWEFEIAAITQEGTTMLPLLRTIGRTPYSFQNSLHRTENAVFVSTTKADAQSMQSVDLIPAETQKRHQDSSLLLVVYGTVEQPMCSFYLSGFTDR